MDEPPRLLGSFVPTPTMMVRGNGVAGGGYSPMGMTGPNTLSLYGPISPYRSVAAPVLLQRTSLGTPGSDLVGVGFSNPFLAGSNPIVYPTRGNIANGFRLQRTPPWWDTGDGWVDQQ